MVLVPLGLLMLGLVILLSRRATGMLTLASRKSMEGLAAGSLDDADRP